MPTKSYSVFDLGLDNHLNRQSSLLSFIPEDTSTPVGAIAMVIPSGIRAEDVTAGEIPQILYSGKQSFSDTTNGMRMGVDTDSTYKWIMGTTGQQIDWNVTTANTLTISGTLSASTIDIGGADATSFHVDIDGNMWLGAATFAAATAFSVSNAGALVSTSGTIAAFTIATTTIAATNLTLTSGAANIANITVGTGATAGGINSANAAGDIIFWGGSTFANRATAPFRVEADGSIICSDITITGGSISSASISSIPNSTATDISLLEKSHDLVFSVTDADTIAWALGTIVFSNGRTFSIAAGNTGNMAALTYIYLDTAVSSTVLQTTTTYSTAMGANRSLLGMAQNNTVTAMFIPYGAGTPLIDGANIGALSIVAGNIAASTITAGKLSVSQLSAITADLGTITAGTVTGATLQTDAGATAGIKIDSTSLRGYDASANITFELVRSTGAVSAANFNFITQLVAGEAVTAGNAVCMINDLFQTGRGSNSTLGDAAARTRIAVRVIPRQTITSTRIDIYKRKVGAPVDNQYIEIQTDSGGSPSGTVITNGTSDTIAGGGVTTTYALTQFSFTAGSFTLTSGTTYWIVILRSGAVDAANYYQYDGTATDYASFLGKSYDGAAWNTLQIPFYLQVVLTTGTQSVTMWQTDSDIAPLSTFFGFATTSPAAGATLSLTTQGVNANQSSLVIGTDYYLSGTAGAISSSKGTFGGGKNRVGVALSTTQILLTSAEPMIEAGQTSRTNASGTGDQVITHNLGRIPKLIKIRTYQDLGTTAVVSDGSATSITAENCTTFDTSAVAGTGVTQSSTIIALVDIGGTDRGTANVTVIDSSSFTLNWTTASTNTSYLQWEAFA